MRSRNLKIVVLSVLFMFVFVSPASASTYAGGKTVEDYVNQSQTKDNTFEFGFNVNGDTADSKQTGKSTQASQRLINYCHMIYNGRYTYPLKTKRPDLERKKVSPTTKPTKEQPLWDQMLTQCEKKNGVYVLSDCDIIEWQVPLGVDGDIQRLMLQAQAELLIPEPGVGLPLFDRAGGKVGVLVRAANWFWTDADAYRAWSKRVEVDGHWAEVTAMPISLEFTPRPGEQPVKCEGPGEVFVPGRDSNAVDAPSGCFYRYRYTTIDDPDMTTTASVGVRWQISWKGSNGKGADIAQIVTSTDQPLQVFEAQTLVTQ